MIKKVLVSIVLILAAAALVSAAAYLVSQVYHQSSDGAGRLRAGRLESGGPPADGEIHAGSHRDEGGRSAHGVLELIKNAAIIAGVVALVVAGQKLNRRGVRRRAPGAA